MFLKVSVVEVDSDDGGAADGYLARNFPDQFMYVSRLARIGVSRITLYQMRDRAGFYQQLDLAHQPQTGILAGVAGAVIIKFADTAELLDDDTVHLVFAVRRGNGVHPDLVFLAGEVLELVRDDCPGNKREQFVLVIHILVLLLDTEHGRLAGAVAGLKQHMSPKGRKWFSIIRIAFRFYFTLLVLAIDTVTPAYHVHGVVIQQLKLAVQFRYVVACSGSRVEQLVFQPAKEAEDIFRPL